MNYGSNSDFEKRTVVIYARVSTEQEAQISALQNQINWYKPILDARPNWTLVGQYVDEGITGTSAAKRPQFMQMIKDAKAGEFNMIITREVSRFARNTVDTLQYTRMLKEHGVEVYFINDNIKTFDGDGELRLTIMATLAQDESRKTSIRVKAGQQVAMEKGVVFTNGSILGYDRVGDQLVINPEQAETVRMIFDLYLDGMGVNNIASEMEKRGRLTAKGCKKWYSSYISNLLRNSFYCGIMTYHKEYVPDYLKQQKIRNRGEIEQIQVKGTHVPIITVEEFKRVEAIRKARSRQIIDKTNKPRIIGIKPNSNVWARLMICKCGNRFRVQPDHRSNKDTNNLQCYTSFNYGSVAVRKKKGLRLECACDTPYFPQWKMELMAKEVFKRYISNGDELMELAYSIIEQTVNKDVEMKEINNDDAIRKKQEDILHLRKKIDSLIDLRSDGDIDIERFRNRKREMEDRIRLLESEISSLTNIIPKETTQDYKELLKQLRTKLESYVDIGDGVIFDYVAEAFISKIWVSKEEVRWYVRVDSSDQNLESNNHIKLGGFTITEEEAFEYKKEINPRTRMYNWFDLHVSVWV